MRKWSVSGWLVLAFISSPSFAQLTDTLRTELVSLQDRATQKKWTFQVGYSSIFQYPLEQVTGLVVPEDWRENAMFALPRVAALPAKFDWRTDAEGLTPIKNQKNCGSCWAFGTVAVLENLLKIRDKVTRDLSEQQLVSCNQEGWGCNGGYFAHSYHKSPGATTTEQFPYTASDVPCRTGLTYTDKILSWAYVGEAAGRAPTVDQLKAAIHEYGPLAVTVAASRSFQAYQGGIYNANDSSAINHLVNLVGWDDENKAWIMRNSWGASWGEQGYMRIKYGVNRIGNQASFVRYKAACAPQPVAMVKTLQTIRPGDSVFVGSMPMAGQSYQWSPETGLDNPRVANPLATPTVTTTYTLKVSNECGQAERQVQVVVE